MKRKLAISAALAAVALIIASAFTPEEQTEVKRGDVLTGGGGLAKVITSGGSLVGDGRTATPLHILTNAGNPNGAITAAKGSILLDTTTPAFYQNAGGGTAWNAIGSLTAGSVTRAQLANGDATSVIGRSANSSGVEADIDSSVDGQVLQRASGALTWATLAAISMPAFTGDVTTSAGAVATTFRSFAAHSILARASGTSGTPTDLASSADGQVLQQASGVLSFAALAAANVTGLAAVATSASASDLTAGTLNAARMPALTGDVTTSAGSVATTIGAHRVTRGMQAQGAGTSIVGVSGGSTADVADIVASADNQILIRTGGALSFSDIGGQVPYLGVFGDGSDGSLTFDGSSVVLGVTPASNVYTMTRDILATNVTINTGVVVVMASTDTQVTNANGAQSYRLFATGTVTITGKIRNNGAAGGTAPTGGGGGAGQLGTSGTGGHAGGNGGAAGGGNAGTNGTGHHTTATLGAGGAGVGGGGNAGGSGGAGGHGSAGNGGNGGSLTVAAVGLGAPRDYRALTTGKGLDSNSFHFGGAGGGGGGGATSQSGGGGGGGGGIVCVIARNITGAGSIEAKGGTGGTAQASGNGGGGGGGGGGTIIVVHAQGTIPTTDVTGGSAGAHLGTGSDGGAGGNGTVFDVKL